MKKTYFLLFLMCTFFAKAQVGINTDVPKTTLEVKKSPTEINAEGIIAPNLTRAEVIARDTKYGTEQSGAMVYVTSVGTEALTTKTQNIISSGYYYFDGLIWRAFAHKNLLYLPSFNLPLTAIGNNFTYDLYTNVYKSQFTKAGNTKFVSSNSSLATVPGILLANQIDYVVTSYDDTIIKINSISNTGVLNYNVLNTNPCGVDCTTTPCVVKPCKSFVNIVLVVK